jgi:hypothetical protein
MEKAILMRDKSLRQKEELGIRNWRKGQHFAANDKETG